MTKISAEVVADSICSGHRITTMKVVMPRIVLAEAKTHRVMKRTDEGMEIYDIPGIGFNDDEMLSRNSASSRAIPFEKMVKAVMEDPFIPIAWQKDHKGMQGTEYFTDPADIQGLINAHLTARDGNIEIAKAIHAAGATKQICNRYLEPFMWHTVLVTATEWENFFHLRTPQYQYQNGKIFRSWKDLVKDAFDSGASRDWVDGLENMTTLERLQHNKGQAEIHMMALAEAMWDARNESTPKQLQPGEWHIPYGEHIQTRADISPEAKDTLHKVVSALMEEMVGVKDLPIAVPLSTALCAQTSYTIVGNDKELSPQEILLDVHHSLLVRPYTNRKGIVFGEDDPKHMSPAEHCAQAMTKQEEENFVKTVAYEKSEHSGYDFNSHTVQFGWCHNLRGWKSYRSMIPNENRR